MPALSGEASSIAGTRASILGATSASRAGPSCSTGTTPHGVSDCGVAHAVADLRTTTRVKIVRSTDYAGRLGAGLACCWRCRGAGRAVSRRDFVTGIVAREEVAGDGAGLFDVRVCPRCCSFCAGFRLETARKRPAFLVAELSVSGGADAALGDCDRGSCSRTAHRSRRHLALRSLRPDWGGLRDI